MARFEAYKELEVILVDLATSSWRWASPWYEKSVACNDVSDGQYLKIITGQ